jgi:hypothetical protein
MMREGRNSNLISIEITQIKISKINLVRMKPREKTLWEKS